MAIGTIALRFSLPPTPHAPASALSPESLSSRARLAAKFMQLPLSFEANRGQAGTAIEFLSRGPGYTVLLTPNSATLALVKRSADAPTYSDVAPVQLRFRGVSATKITGEQALPGKNNYLLGDDPRKWRTNIPTYARAHYAQIYSGIDLDFYGQNGQIEFDFNVAPGADPSRIRLEYGGSADGLAMDANGDLLVRTAAGELRQKRPTAYQEANGRRTIVPVSYLLHGARQVSLRVAPYDRARTLLIDPVLIYSTFIGNGSPEGITVDSAGNAYITGTTNASTYPTTAGSFQPNFNAATCGGGDETFPCSDAFVTKFNANGTAQIYSTFLGGNGQDSGIAIAVDSTGNAYVLGQTFSSNFPITIVIGGGSFALGDSFVAKLNASGSSLAYAAAIPAGGASDIKVDASGHAYIAGATGPGFPTTSGAFKAGSATNPAGDAFVAKLAVDGSAFDYATMLGGSSSENVFGAIALDAAGDVYITGQTFSNDFPTTPGTLQPSPQGFPQNFLTKLNSSGTSLLYSTYLPSTAGSSFSVAADSAGNTCVTGAAFGGLRTTSGAFQTAYGGGIADAFLVKVNPNATALLYSTYLGGSGFDIGIDVAIDGAGNCYVAGHTYSTDFPVKAAIQESLASSPFPNQDLFVTEVNPSGSALVFSTYLGGSGQESEAGMVRDASGNIFLAATAESGFPTTPGAFSTTGFGVVAKIGTPTAEQQFRLCLLFDPDQPRQSGSAIPMKVQLCDATEDNVSSPQIRLKAISISPTSNLAQLLPVHDAGNANAGGLFRFIGDKGGAYIFNLDTRGLSAGTYVLRIRVDSDTTMLSVQFAIK